MQFTTVDGCEGESGPASSTHSSAPAPAARAATSASSADAAGGFPGRFALVEVRGRRSRSISSRVTGCDVTRTATPALSPRTTAGKLPDGSASTRVSAPGQNTDASSRAAGVHASPATAAGEGTSSRKGWARSGLSRRRAAIASSVASPPNP